MRAILVAPPLYCFRSLSVCVWCTGTPRFANVFSDVRIERQLEATRLTKPRNSTKLETSRRARFDCFLLSRRAQPPLITGKGTRTRVVALHRCATRMATAAIDAIGPVPPTKIAKCIIIPRRAD